MAAWELNPGSRIRAQYRATTSGHFGEAAVPGGGGGVAARAPTLLLHTGVYFTAEENHGKTSGWPKCAPLISREHIFWPKFSMRP
jgi:hypothetical protein